MKKNLFNFKKLLAVLICSVMITGLLSGCSFIYDYIERDYGYAYEDMRNLPDAELKEITQPAVTDDEDLVDNIVKFNVFIMNFSDAKSDNYNSSGSGIVIEENGIVLTNAHVVSGAQKLKVATKQNDIIKYYNAEVLGSDTYTDLAVIAIDLKGEKLSTAKLVDSAGLRQGSDVVAVGNPAGFEYINTTTFGKVSNLGINISHTGFNVECIMTDTAINPGNSGGALVNKFGEVVGVNSSKIASVNYEGMGFAIAINETTLQIINDLKTYGFVSTRPYLGLTVRYINNASLPSGLLITEFNDLNGVNKIFTTKNAVGYAEKETATGTIITAGTIITKLGDVTVNSIDDLGKFLQTYKAGDQVKISMKTFQYNATKDKYDILEDLIEFNTILAPKGPINK